MRNIAFVFLTLLAACHTASDVGFKDFPVERPVAFVPSSENGGKGCTAAYYGTGQGDGVLDDRCFDLQTRLTEASRTGNVVLIKSLLADGANANSTAGDLYSPLDAAADYGQTEAAKMLLDNGADINRYHPIHGFPLLRASNRGNTETVELLLSRGANVNLESDGYTPLRAALEGRHPEVVALLKRAGAH